MLKTAVSFALLLILAACEPSFAPGHQERQAVNLRIATFNIAMGLSEQGQLGQALARDDDPRLLQLAEILQRVRPDIILLNEFDYDPDTQSASLFIQNYLAQSQNDQPPIHFPYSFRAEVNTGLDSGMDLNNNGKTGEAGDAYGYGDFPGQYGMLVLSQVPLQPEYSRGFQNFLWSMLSITYYQRFGDFAP